MTTHEPPAPGLIRLATSSPATQPTTAATLAQLRLIARRAADAHRADVLLLPEAYVGGYPRGSSFGCVVGGRTAEGRDEFLRYFESAVDLGDVVGEGGAGGGEAWVRRGLPGGDGGTAEEGEEGRRGDGTREELEAVAAETGVFLVVGCIEKAGGSLYCAAVYVCPKKGMIGKRRKVMPTGTERLIWAQGSPRTLQAVSTVIRGVRINMAAAICWENYMPLLRQALYAQNVNLYLAPTADGRDAWLSLMRSVGVEGRCFVVSSNMCVRDTPGGGGPEARGNGSAPAVEDHDDENGAAVAATGDVSPYGQEGPRARRNSAITPEGFEIALPAHGGGGGGAGAGKQQRRRRQSVLDENGNEIVLCRAEGNEGTTIEVNNIPGDKPNGRPGASKKTAGGGGRGAGFVSRGGSCITNPFGDVLAGPQWEDDEGIIYADVDFKDCIRGRLDLDAAGSYSRNDSFKFSVEGLHLTPLPY